MKLIIKEATHLVPFSGKVIHLKKGEELELAESQDEPLDNTCKQANVWVHAPETGTRIEVTTRIFTMESLKRANLIN